ncbi:hypothetical protein LguiB_004237 [Lonicera macranthoides]
MKGGGPKTKPVSKSIKANHQFLVGSSNRYLKKGRYSQCIGTTATVYLAAVLEYLVALILELVRNAKGHNKKNKIIQEISKRMTKTDRKEDTDNEIEIEIDGNA